MDSESLSSLVATSAQFLEHTKDSINYFWNEWPSDSLSFHSRETEASLLFILWYLDWPPFSHWRYTQVHTHTHGPPFSHWRYTQVHTHTHTHTHGLPVVKNSPANAGVTGDTGLIPGLGRSPGGGHGNPFQYSCLENSKGRGA